MSDAIKRKVRPAGERGCGGRGGKISKGGSGGRWNTPHQLAVAASRISGRIEPGDSGIWATCARGMEGKATEELRLFLEECAQKLYGIIADAPQVEEEEDDDIEAYIQKEIKALGKSKSAPKLFSPVYLDLQCVLFFKTGPPIDPVKFVEDIIKLVVEEPNLYRTRYINRLTPMTLMEKATEKGLQELSSKVLSKHFRLATHDSQEENQESTNGNRFSYAIRPTIRNHNTLKRDEVIKQIAASISNSHQVDLVNADRVIIIEIYQGICGMSVVMGKEWEMHKRYNLNELCPPKIKPSMTSVNAPNFKSNQQ
ncbi:BgtA-20951 [Blumeria graminis f. sp. tritici]|uniref:BgtA-20951 n=2 Tax=Blumeria graminis f. sp. tritici TaxID=62690 RepID=A0A9X9MI95_BLUGR|nr:hypothetical protein BGT96224_A20951 [Blumeria graminis f. sp. tritici 96224]VDB89054.1 BgtA-20951 [Blumeria graminis f. sp. tritici]